MMHIWDLCDFMMGKRGACADGLPREGLGCNLVRTSSIARDLHGLQPQSGSSNSDCMCIASMLGQHSDIDPHHAGTQVSAPNASR